MSESKKILIFGPLHPYRGGIAHFSDALLKELAARPCCSLKTLNFRRLYPKFLFPGKSQFEPQTPSLERSEEDVIDTLNPFTWYTAARRIADSGASTIILPFWEPFVGVVFGMILRLCQMMMPRLPKVIVIVHNASAHDRRLGGGLMMRFLLKQAGQVVTLSESVTAALMVKQVIAAPVTQLFHPVYEHFGDKVPASMARRALGLSMDRPVVLFFGLIRRYKGLHVLIDAIRLVREEHSDILLLVAGEFYEEQEPYLAQIQGHGLHDNVAIVDAYIPGCEVTNYFSAADLLVLPYLTASQSGVLSAAVHFGTPSVITAPLASSDPTQATCTVVPPADPEALSSAILRHFAGPKMDRAALDGQRPAHRHTWEAFCDQLLNLCAG